MPIGDLSLHEQKDAFRHVEEMSQRFLRLILATLALGVVFARPSWVDYMTSASPPSPGLRADRGGGYIGQLSSTMVSYNGSILKILVILALISIIIAIVLAGLVLFLREPSELLNSDQENAVAFLLLQKKSKTLLRRAYIAAFTGVVFLMLAAAGFWAFYVTGGLSILIFDTVIVIIGVVSLPALIMRIYSSTDHHLFEGIKSLQRVVELVIYSMSAIVAIVFYRYVMMNAISTLVIWGQITGII